MLNKVENEALETSALEKEVRQHSQERELRFCSVTSEVQIGNIQKISEE